MSALKDFCEWFQLLCGDEIYSECLLFSVFYSCGVCVLLFPTGEHNMVIGEYVSGTVLEYSEEAVFNEKM